MKNIKTKLTSLKRVNLILNHKEPDRVPIDFGSRETTIHEESYKRLKDYLGLDRKKIEYKQYFLKSVEVEKEILDYIGSDILNFEIGMEKISNPKLIADYERDIFANEWGTKYKISKDRNFFHFYEFPLKSLDKSEIDNFKWPDVINRVDNIKDELLKEYEKKEKAIILSGVSSMISIHWFLRGLEQSYMDFAIQPKGTNYLFNKILEWQIKMWEEILNKIGSYIHIVEVSSDDVAGEKGLLISPEFYRENIKPCQKKLINFVRSKTKGKIFFHSCGAVYEIIPDFIEIGVDILNPVQIDAANMDSKRLKKDFGDCIVFDGGGCANTILQDGTTDEVKSEVKRKLADFMPGGGYIFAPIHNIQAGVPEKNIITLFEAVKEFGNYN